MDLAGSVTPEDVEGEEEGQGKDEEQLSSLEARPDLKIRLRKPSGRSVLFHCSLPSSVEEATTHEQDSSNLRTISLCFLIKYFSHILRRHGRNRKDTWLLCLHRSL